MDRREELERKRKKLEEMRARKPAAASTKPEAAGAPAATIDVDDLVNSLVGVSVAPAAAVAPAAEVSRAPSASPSLAATEPVPAAAAPAPVAVKLVEVEAYSIEVPHKETIVYSKEVQTDPMEEAEFDAPAPVDTPTIAAQTAVVTEEPAVPEAPPKAEDLITEMSEAERAAVINSQNFRDFFERTARVVERVLDDPYDFMVDYAADTIVHDKVGAVKLRHSFTLDKCRNRVVTDIDWSPHHTELFLSSYHSSPDRPLASSSKGLVLLWSLHLHSKPEYEFHAPSEVLTARFSPAHQHLVVGGTDAGQILIWDLRSGHHMPELKTPLSSERGHTLPIWSVEMQGSQTAQQLLSLSSDGLLCTWSMDKLSQPEHTEQLGVGVGVGASANRPDFAVTSIAYPENDATTVFLGAEDGGIYQANRTDRAVGSKTGLNMSEVYRGHNGPVTGLHLHPKGGDVDLSEYCISSSIDWSVKLWRVRKAGASGSGAAASTATSSHASPVFTFEAGTDYVMDARWSPVHPAVFAAGGCDSKLSLWNLNSSFQAPVGEVGTGAAINKVRWSRDGTKIALGLLDGSVQIYDVDETLSTPQKDDWTRLQRALKAEASNVGR